MLSGLTARHDNHHSKAKGIVMSTTMQIQRIKRFGAAGLVAASATVLAACGQGISADSQSNSASAQDVCDTCGTITQITPVQTEGETSGAGAVAGAIIGGVIGHQFGSGSGNDAATAAGAVGGAVAGNEVEERRNANTVYRVKVDMNRGPTRTVDLASAEGFTVGDRVRVTGDRLVHV